MHPRLYIHSVTHSQKLFYTSISILNLLKFVLMSTIFFPRCKLFLALLSNVATHAASIFATRKHRLKKKKRTQVLQKIACWLYYIFVCFNLFGKRKKNKVLWIIRRKFPFYNCYSLWLTSFKYQFCFFVFHYVVSRTAIKTDIVRQV